MRTTGDDMLLRPPAARRAEAPVHGAWCMVLGAWCMAVQAVRQTGNHGTEAKL